MKQFQWVEKFRPDSIDQCILPDKLKQTFNGIVKCGDIPNLLLFGKAGTGKTSVALALASQLKYDTLFINGSLGAEESGIDAVRTRIKQFAEPTSLSGRRKVVIIDEAEHLTLKAQDALRSLIEQNAKNCAFIFTCNSKNEFIEPLHSRFAHIEFKINKADKANIAGLQYKRLFYILETEGVIISDKKILANLIMKFFPDFRRCIHELQMFCIQHDNKLTEGILANKLDGTILVKALKDKDYNAARAWTIDALSEEAGTLYKKIYEILEPHIKKECIPTLVTILGEHQRWTSFVPDHEIEFMFMFTEIMLDEDIIFV